MKKFLESLKQAGRSIHAMNLPNKLTLLRVALVPLYLVLLWFFDNDKSMQIWPLLVFTLAAFLCAELLLRGGALNTVDQRIQDAWIQWQGKRAEAKHVLLVTLDEETLAAYPDEPMVFWTDRLALAVERLRAAGVTVIGLDMLLSISPERWLGKLGGDLQQAARDYDRPFREQVNSGQLSLAATRSGAGGKESDYLLPSPDYLLALPEFDIPGHVALADLLD